MKKYLIVVIIIFLSAVSAYSQNGGAIDSTLREIEGMYNSARYVDAELEARRLLEVPSIADSAAVRIEQWIAFSLIAQGKNSPARDRFIALLKIDPEYELDPVLTSPKILTVFNDARSMFLSSRRSQSSGEPSALFPQRGQITFRTLLFPGWEQHYQGKSTKGMIFLGAGAAALGSGIVFEALRSDARTEYLNATRPSDIAEKYDSYNTYRKAEIYSFIAFAVVYIVSEIDVVSSQDFPAISYHPSLRENNGHFLTVTVPW
jgi:hypothetical protein